MFKIYFRTLIVSWKIYGFGKVFLSHLIVEALTRLFAFFTLFLDNIFFPGYRKIKVKNPVFIMGHPRSGTTFLHHLLTSNDSVAAFKTWHLLLPSLTARVLLKPLVHFLVKKGETEVMPEWTGHKVELDKTEEEEMLFLHNYDTNFVSIGMLSFDEQEHLELRCHDKQPKAKRWRSMRLLDGCFKRHIYYTGQEQIIAQTHFSTFRLKTMLEFYPDAKFIFVLRSPQHVVPSFLSLLHNSIRFRWGIDEIPAEVLDRYNERRYQDVLALYLYFSDLHKNGDLPKERVMVLPYELLRSDLEKAFERVVDFADLTVGSQLRKAVTERAQKQENYQRKHQVYDLDVFGLTRERISKDFQFIFEGYGIEDD